MVIRRARGSVAMPLCPSQVLITTAVLFLVAISNTDGRDTATLNCLALECEYKCRASPIGGECFCLEGKKIANDSKTCIEHDKCAEWGFCDQLCKKTNAKSYTCSCNAGYALQVDGKKCVANNGAGSLQVYFAYGGGVLRVDPRFKNQTLVVGNTVAGAVDYHYASNTLFWLDANRKSVKSARLLDTRGGFAREKWPAEISLAGLARDPVSMAVDWVGHKLYVVDGLGLKIDVVELKPGGRWHSVALSSNLTGPSDIALDPTRGYAFVADGNRLVRANMDGTDTKAIVTEDVSQASGVAVDILGRRVYWCDSLLNRIETVDYEGNGRHTVLQQNGSAESASPSRLAVFENKVYWSDGTKLQGVLSVNKYDPATVSPVYQNRDVKSARSVKIVHSFVQPEVSSLCSKNNAGCHHMCITSRGGNGSLTYKCACSIGYQLAQDKHNCVEINEFLLYSQQSFVKGKILNDTRQGFIDAMQPITEESARFVGLDFDAHDNYIYYSDDLQDVIYRARRNGTGKEIVFDSQNDGVEGIAVDWVAKNLYYVGSKSGTINVLSTRNVTNKSVLLRNMKKPKAIAVHPNKGYIFFTEWHRPISIIRTYTDGSNLMVFPDITLGWPNGLAVDYESNRLYWCDALLDHVQHSDLDGTDVKTIDTAMIRHPTSIVTHQDWLYITDGRMNAIIKMHKLTGSASEARVREPQKTYGVKIYGKREQPVDRSHPCTPVSDRGGCQKLCFGIPSGQSAKLQVQCGCPTGEKIHADGKTCVTDDLDTESAPVDGFFE